MVKLKTNVSVATLRHTRFRLTRFKGFPLTIVSWIGEIGSMWRIFRRGNEPGSWIGDYDSADAALAGLTGNPEARQCEGSRLISLPTFS